MKSLTGKMLLRFLIPFCMIMSIGSFANAQCTLGPGDLVFTAYNALDDGNGPSGLDDSFSFLLLKDVSAGQVIYFTDLGWTDANAFQTADKGRSDAVIRWTADVNYPAGTELIVTCKYTLAVKDFGGTPRGTIAMEQESYNTAVGGLNPAEHMSLAEINSDQIFAFTGSIASPNFLAGISINGVPNSPWLSSLPAANTNAGGSRLPSQLATGAQNLGIAYRDPGDPAFPAAPGARYIKTTPAVIAGTPAALLAAINDNTKWFIQNDGNPLNPLLSAETYAVSGVAITTQPTDRLNLCPGTGTTFVINATSVCGYQWQVSVDGGSIYNNISNGGVYSGATTAILTISNVAGLNNNKYRVVLTGSGGGNSNAATLTLLDPTLVFNTTTVAAGTFDTAYSQSINISAGGNGTYTYSLFSGTLPTGLTLNPTSGVLSGVPTAVGSFTFTIRATDGCATPNTANQTYTLVINKADQTITYTLAPKTYGDAAFTLPMNASSGLAISYTSSNPAVASIAGNTVTITGAGTSDITATQAGNTNINAAPPVIQTLTVATKAITLALNAAPLISKAYDNTTAATLAPANYTLNGLAGADAVTVTSTASYNSADAGTGKTITANNFVLAGAQKDNYNLTTLTATTTGTITALPVTVAINALPLVSKTYDNSTTATLAPGNYTLNGILVSDAITVSATANYATKDAGLGQTITANNFVLDGTGKDNYTVSTVSATTTGDINPLSVSLSLNATPAITKVYDLTTTATLAEGNYSLTGILGADAVTVSGTANYDTEAVGSGKTITANAFILAGAQKDNYTLTTTTATTSGSITALPLTIALNATPLITKAYDNSAAAVLVPANYTLTGVLGADEVTVTGNASYNNENAGTGKTITVNTFVLAGAQKDNYSLTTTTASTTGDITAIPVTVALNATPLVTKVYDNTTNATLSSGNYSLTGILPTDLVSVTATANYDTKDAGMGKTVTATTFVLAGVDKDNYTLTTTTASTTGDITTIPLTLALNASPLITKIYDQSTVATLAPANYLLTGILGGDEVTVTGTANYDTKQAGVGKTITANTFVLAGAQKDNYSLTTSSATTTGNITTSALTLTLNTTPQISKAYDNTTTASLQPANYTLNGLASGDEVTVSGTANYDTKDAGIGKTITANTFVLAGAQKDNYSLSTTTATTTGDITAIPLSLALNASPLITKTYDDAVTATLSPANYTLSGLLGADAVSVTGTAVYDTKDAGTGKTITANTFVLAGAQKDNYSLATTSATTTGNISAKDVTLALNASPLITKVYDNSTTATLLPANYSLTGVLGTDEVTVSGTANYDTKNMGIGKTITVNSFALAGTQKDNYNLTTSSATTTGNISAAELTVALNASPAITKVYNNSNLATLVPANYTLTGILGTDAVTVSSTATYDNKDAGTGKTVTAEAFVLAGAQKDNYSLTTTSAATTGDITPLPVTLALNVSPAITKIYDGNISATLIASNYTLNTILGSDIVGVSGTANYNTKDAGTGKLITANAFTLSGAQKDNYSLTTTSASTSGDITTKTLTVTADDKTKFQGLANPPLTFAYNGFIGGEDAGSLSTIPAASTTATTSSPIGNYPITVAGGAALNYNFAYVNGMLAVVPGAPTSLILTAVPLYENAAAGATAGTFNSTSLNPISTFSYSLVAGAGDTDNAAFTISGDQLKSAVVFDYEAKSAYQIRVRTTTQFGLSIDEQFTVNITDVNEVPTLDAIANQTICYITATQNITLSGISAGPETSQTTSLTVSSNNTALFQNLSVNAAGVLSYRIKNGATGTSTVTVTVKDNGGTANGGVDSFNRDFTVQVNALPVINISPDKGNLLSTLNAEISKGETVKLTASGGVSYVWSANSSIISGQNSATLTVRPGISTSYTVTATNASGCTDTQTFRLEVLDDLLKINATNILSPNGDGYNDKWIVENIDLYPNNEVKIFDKAGRIVYTKRGYDNSWDGMVSGNPLSEGTYYYIIDFGANRRKFKGFITIVREN